MSSTVPEMLINFVHTFVQLSTDLRAVSHCINPVESQSSPSPSPGALLPALNPKRGGLSLDECHGAGDWRPNVEERPGVEERRRHRFTGLAGNMCVVLLE